MKTPGFDCTGVIVRVRFRVMEEIAQQTSELHRTVRASEGSWAVVAPGVERKTLWERGESSTSMLRIAAGTSFPSHAHVMDEECLILEGSLQIGDVLLGPGDFHVGLSGVDHDDASTQDGCVCFLRTARDFFEPAA